MTKLLINFCMQNISMYIYIIYIHIYIYIYIYIIYIYYICIYIILMFVHSPTMGSRSMPDVVVYSSKNTVKPILLKICTRISIRTVYRIQII